jgi:crotonobetainyl-CoA:carnitine CoA-transferase CaiB-like acyl-CoA transferase
MLADPRFASTIERVRNRPALDAAIERVTTGLEREAVIARLDEAAIAYGRLTDVADIAAHPQNRFIEVTTSAGPVELLEPPGGAAGRRAHFGAVPELGAQTERVRAEFGRP